MKIAAIVPDESPNAMYRVYQPMAEMARRGHLVKVWQMSELSQPRTLLDFDVVYAWRLHGDAFLRSARMVSESGVGLVWDNDDDVRSIDVRGRAAQKYFGGLNGHRVFGLMVRLMQLSTIVTTPSQRLAELYREASGADVRVVENHVAAIAEIKRPRRPKATDPVTVGWIANTEHQTDIERLRLREPMQRLLDDIPNLQIVSVGCGLGLEGDRYHHTRGVPFEQLREQIAQFDIGIAPIADSGFNQARSNIKVKEYAALGVPWLASPIGPYADLGEAHGGRLVADDRWYEAVRDLALDARARRKLSRRGTAWAKRETIAANGHHWEAVLSAAAQRGDHARAAG